MVERFLITLLPLTTTTVEYLDLGTDEVFAHLHGMCLEFGDNQEERQLAAVEEVDNRITQRLHGGATTDVIAADVEEPSSDVGSTAGNTSPAFFNSALPS